MLDEEADVYMRVPGWGSCPCIHRDRFRVCGLGSRFEGKVKVRDTFGGCAKGHCKEGATRNTLHSKGGLGTYNYGHFGDRFF